MSISFSHASQMQQIDLIAPVNHRSVFAHVVARHFLNGNFAR
jgi:hypothetical protein